MNEEELRNLMYTAQLKDKGPFVIRYPRGNGVLADWHKEFTEIPVGTGRKLREGTDLAILSIGHPGNAVAAACIKLEKENISVAHYDMRFVKPLDETLLHSVFKKFKTVITVEDGMITGGTGSAILEFMSVNDYNSKLVRLGIPDRFTDQGTLPELYAECGFDEAGIIKTAKKLVGKRILFSTG
jgi:1-deoxy-D-xylulose-5-phosphate synthase